VAAPLLINGYRLEDTVAVGGSGTVYRAVREDGEVVAFKLMHRHLEDRDAEWRRFQREAQIVKTLVHPNVVELLDYGHDAQGVPYLVFPLLAGEPLSDRLERGPLDVATTGRLVLDVLSALERAHALGIAHRDIKPANIFLAVEEDDSIVAKVLDFGLAKLAQNVGGDITRTGALIGTPRYMAPEQVRGERIGLAADIYSVGLVMAEMLCGEPVVQAETELEVYMAHGSDRPLELAPEVMRSPFAAIIRRAVTKELDVRYQTASQMHADVEAVASLYRRLGDAAIVASADLDKTQVLGKAERKQKGGTAGSAKLREVFNRLADKKDKVPDAAPTLRRAVPPSIPSANESLPFLLTREQRDPDEETQRIPKKKRDE
jgi:eukaryotic-like serine/threonine-protein kinase